MTDSNNTFEQRNLPQSKIRWL